MKATKSAIVFGAAGMVGASVSRCLHASGYLVNEVQRKDYDLLNQEEVASAYSNSGAIDCAVVAAAKVGGIYANNTYPAEFIYQNLLIEAHTIHQGFKAGVPRLIFLGSSCIYPKFANQPITESELLTGSLEPTNDSYAIAKIAGIKLCEAYNRQYDTDFRSLMPTNLYGPGDNYSGENSHVIPALMKKFADACEGITSSVLIWGTGTARRDFLHNDDLAKAVKYCMEIERKDFWANLDSQESHINVGTGTDVSIKELALLLKEISGFTGNLEFDTSKPDGTPRKLLNTRKISAIGWQPTIELGDGLESTYKDYLKNRQINATASIERL